MRAGVDRIGALRQFLAGDETIEIWPELDAPMLKYPSIDRKVFLAMLDSAGLLLSSMIGAIYLKLQEERVETTGLGYARFMDDWVILAPTRWQR